MEILEHGMYAKDKIKFECTCGCKFKANFKEITTYKSPCYTPYKGHFTRLTYAVECPECGDLVIVIDDNNDMK